VNTPVAARAKTAAPWALGVFAVLFVLFFFRALPLELDPVRTTNTPDQFDAERAISRLSNILDGTPHPVDSASLDETRARLMQEIRSLGYSPELRAANVCQALSGMSARCAFVQNIFFTAGPTEGPALVLSAHYDSVEASPGFGDDGIGLAVWLEVAHHLKQQPPSRPVVFLLTDGEETGLLGAQAFVDHQDDYPFKVGRIINLEARGVRGPALMFETGHPNAGVVNDWARNGARPFSNSMMTAVYELLPNSTDLTVHLNAGFNGINIAISDGLDFYHTNHDDLAHLNRASVQHMGDQALGATRVYIASDWSSDRTAGEIAYADLGSRIFVALPQMFALVLLGLCFGISAMMLVRPTRDGGWQKLDWRAFAFPPAFIAVAGLAVFLLQQLLSLIRPEAGFWTAYPQGLNMAIFAVTALVGAAGLSWLTPKSTREAIYASGWFWFLIAGMGLTFAVAGFSMIFLIPGVAFVLMGGAAWLFPRYQLIFYGVASAVLALVFFPMLHLLDVMMGLSLSAMFGVIEAQVLAAMLAMIGGLASGKLKVVAALGGAALVAIATTISLPAYSVERPLALNFTAHYDLDERKAAVFAGARAGSLPQSVRDQLTVGENPSPPGCAPDLASRAIAFTPPGAADATVISDTTAPDGRRTVRLQLTAPDARQVRLRIPGAANPAAVAFGGKEYALKAGPAKTYIVDVTGRAANGTTLDITLAPRPPEAKDKAPPWMVQGFWARLPDDAKSLADARPDTAVRIQMGDVSITTRKLPL
jgi:Peptidase family M28